MNNIESLFFDFLKLRREVRRQAFLSPTVIIQSQPHLQKRYYAAFLLLMWLSRQINLRECTCSGKHDSDIFHKFARL